MHPRLVQAMGGQPGLRALQERLPRAGAEAHSDPPVLRAADA